MRASVLKATVTQDAAAVGARCYFKGVAVSAAGTGTVTLYDNASAATGTIIWQGTGPVSFHLRDDDVKCDNGVYVDLTGTNTVTVYYVTY